MGEKPMIDEALYRHIKTVLGVTNIYFGSAEGIQYPFHIMSKLTDMERPETLCDEQGDTGRAVFMFDSYVGGQKNAGSAATAVLFAETLKNQVNKIKGTIGTAGNRYRIWNNETHGVTLKDRESMQTLTIFGAEFESILWWEKLADDET